MNFSDFVGNVSNRLRKEMNASRPVHAYLFTGPAGTGKRSLANICARALLCEGPMWRPCDTCPACRRFLTGNHPDVLFVKPEPGKKTIAVQSFRDSEEIGMPWLYNRPFEARRRVMVINNADEVMGLPSQNAFLKTLEDPPGNNVIIMTANNGNALLPTVISRCRVIRFPPLGEEETVKALIMRGIAPDRARLFAKLSLGSVGEALKLCADEGFSARRATVLTALQKLHGPQDVGTAALPLISAEREDAESILDILELCARDIMALKDAGASVIQSDSESKLRHLNIRGGDMLSAVFEARKMLRSNVNWQYTLETLFFKITGGTVWQP